MPAITQEVALAKALEIIDSRLRFNVSLKLFFSTCNNDEAKDYFRKRLDAKTLTDLNNDNIVQKYRQDFIAACNSDITRITKLKKLILAYIEDDSEENLGIIALLLQELIKSEEKQISNIRTGIQQQHKSLQQQAKAEAKSAHIGLANKQKQRKAANAAVRKVAAQQPTILDAVSDLELDFWIEIYCILENHVLTREINNMAARDVEYQFSQEGRFSISLSARFDARNKKAANEEVDRIKQLLMNNIEILGVHRLQHYLETVAKACKYNQEDQTRNENGSPKLQNDYSGLRNIVSLYLFRLRVPNALSQIHSDLQKEIIDTKQRLLREQREAENAERLQEEHRRYKDINSEIKAELIARHKAKVEQDEFKKQEAAKKRQEELNKLEKTQREAFTKRYRAMVEEARKQKAHSKAQRVQDAYIGQLPNAEQRSRLTLPHEVILKNAEALIALFDKRRKRLIKGDDVETLIRKLGGQIIKKNAKSTHFRIEFHGSTYVEFESFEEEQASMTSTSGYATKYEVCGHNFDLLRNAINSVLPDNWQQLIEQHRQSIHIVNVAGNFM